MKIRKAIKLDIKHILKLEKRYMDSDAILNDITYKFKSSDLYILENNKKIIGYCEYKINNKNIYIKSIVSPNYGVIFLSKLERIWKKYNNIKLSVSLSKNEKKKKQMIKLNFYYKMKYKCINIKFPKNSNKNFIELIMFKKLNKN
jgi:hypothetical protein